MRRVPGKTIGWSVWLSLSLFGLGCAFDGSGLGLQPDDANGLQFLDATADHEVDQVVPDGGADLVAADAAPLDTRPDLAPDLMPDAPPSRLRVFITSALYRGGEIGGVAAADALCQEGAEEQGVDGAWRAWISDDASSPDTRFTKSSVPYELLDGTVIADDWADLTDGSLAAAINMTEIQDMVDVGQPVWTNTAISGQRFYHTPPHHCTGWSNNNQTGLLGLVATDATWTKAYTIGCSTPAHLYCFEQEPGG